MEQAAAGNKRKRRELWDYWTPRLSLFIKSDYSLSREDREDIIQDIMEKIYKSLDRYNPLYSPSTWIYTIARRTLKDRKRQKGRNAVRDRDDPTDWESIPSLAETPESALMRREDLLRIRQFIASQDQKDRQILFLTCYEEMSGRRAAKTLNIPAGTARDRIRIMKNQLEDIWNEEER